MLQKLQLRPGVNKEGTNYSNEGGWYDTDKVRFRSGFPEKIGGWVNIGAGTFKGVARTLWNWVALAGNNLLAVGTNQKVYVEQGGAYNDITPLDNTVALAADPFATTNASKVVTVTHATHGKTAGTYVTFSGATAVGGLTLNGEYEIVNVASANTYLIVSATAAGSTTTGGGAGVSAAYQLVPGGAGYTTSTGWGAGAYGRGGWSSAASVGIGQQLRLWSLDNYGQNLVLVARGGTPYYWALDLSTYPRAITLASASTTAGYSGTFVPTSTYQMVASDIQRFAIAIGANPYDPLNANTAFDPMLVRWSDQENIFDWVPSASNQSGEQRMSHGSVLITARHTRQETLIWSDAALFSMQYQGPPYVYGFTLLADNISIISPESPVTVNGVTYWMGMDKFYVYTGRTETLPCTLKQYIFTNLNYDQAYQIISGVNEEYNEVWWVYPSANSLVNDRYVVYNHLEHIWYHGSLERTAWLDSPLRNYPMAAFSIQNTYLATALTATTSFVTLTDGTSYPSSGTVLIDSEQISYTAIDSNTLLNCVRGVNNTTAAAHSQYAPVTFTIPNQVMFHEYGQDDVSSGTAVGIDAYIQSSDFDIGDGHQFGFVWRMLPDVTFSGSNATNPSVMLELQARQNSGTNYAPAASPTVTRTATIPVEQFTGQVYTRVRGRQMSFRISSVDVGVAWQLGTPRIDIRQDGRKS